jgi:hypothetical protein
MAYSQVSDSPLTRYIVALILMNFALGSLIASSPWSVVLLRHMTTIACRQDEQR